jgi:hypothetical protein
METKQEKVIVRMWCKEPKTAILFFPEWDCVNYGRIASWEHIGQHGEASPLIMSKPDTRIATDQETKDAIEQYEWGYNCKGTLKPVKRLNRNALSKIWQKNIETQNRIDSFSCVKSLG